LAGAHLGGAAHRARREAGEQRVERVLARRQPADHVRDDVHHMAVELDRVAVGDPHAPGVRDAADIVTAQIEQHQMLGAFLGIGEQAGAVLFVFRRGLAARAGAGDRADRHFAVAHADEDLRARSRQREARQVEMV
ncbi:hypothetical protein QU38_00915, partial [Staphylococcus aureus]